MNSLAPRAHAVECSLIVEQSEAVRVIQRLLSASSLALDTEGDGMFRYRARLCAMQLHGAGEIAVIDTLACAAAPLFCELLGPNGPEKIVHDAAFDARILFANGVRVARVFDTAVAARFLGLPSTGLSRLVEHYFGLHLPKHGQQADWGTRPLDGEAMRYLEDDVRYLPELAALLLAEVRAQDIEAEVRTECAHVVAEAQRHYERERAWLRVKGAALLAPRERACLAELAEERERLAECYDVPPGRFLANDALLNIARARPRDDNALAALLGSRAEHSHAFLSALERAEAHDDAPEAEVQKLLPRPPSVDELTRKKRRKQLLSQFRERHAKARGVSVQVVLPGHCLEDILGLATLNADTLANIAGFGACRIERYGALLTQLNSHWEA